MNTTIQPNSQEQVALHWIARNGHEKFIRPLVKRAPDPLTAARAIAMYMKDIQSPFAHQIELINWLAVAATFTD